MPAGVLAVVVWTCVGLFVGVVLLGFAALAAGVALALGARSLTHLLA